uniref:Uncharacterized protein n=1 Tax=viral metagenome TaxID=1070528 RepID=A0A6C0AQI3_9ZZZZ
MLTRHLYRFDEVKVALSYSICRGRAEEAAFWCQELVDSGAIVQAWAVLLETWLWQALVLDPGWIGDTCYNPDVLSKPEELHRAAYRLSMVCRDGRDNSLWAVLVLGSNESVVPDRPCLRLPTQKAYQTTLQKYFASCLFQGKVLCAWWAYSKLGPDLAEPYMRGSSLHKIMETVGLVGTEWTIIGTCARIIHQNVIDIHRAPSPYSSLPPSLEASIKSWTSITGRRSRRLYPIPLECLYGRTVRGTMGSKDTTLAELRSLEDQFPLSPFWASPWSQASQSDDALEEFYGAYFPDDIPDEWSLADQKKSHGPGILRSGQTLDLATLGRLWMTGESRFAWGFYEWSASVVLNMEIDKGCVLDLADVAQLYMTREDTSVADELLEPMRKMLIVS